MAWPKPRRYNSVSQANSGTFVGGRFCLVDNSEPGPGARGDWDDPFATIATAVAAATTGDELVVNKGDANYTDQIIPAGKDLDLRSMGAVFDRDGGLNIQLDGENLRVTGRPDVLSDAAAGSLWGRIRNGGVLQGEFGNLEGGLHFDSGADCKADIDCLNLVTGDEKGFRIFDVNAILNLLVRGDLTIGEQTFLWNEGGDVHMEFARSIAETVVKNATNRHTFRCADGGTNFIRIRGDHNLGTLTNGCNAAKSDNGVTYYHADGVVSSGATEADADAALFVCTNGGRMYIKARRLDVASSYGALYTSFADNIVHFDVDEIHGTSTILRIQPSADGADHIVHLRGLLHTTGAQIFNLLGAGGRDVQIHLAAGTRIVCDNLTGDPVSLTGGGTKTIIAHGECFINKAWNASDIVYEGGPFTVDANVAFV